MPGLYIALGLIVAAVVSGMIGGKDIEKPTRLFNLFRRRRNSNNLSTGGGVRLRHDSHMARNRQATSRSRYEKG